MILTRSSPPQSNMGIIWHEGPFWTLGPRPQVREMSANPDLSLAPSPLSLPTHSTSRICTTYSGFILYRFQYLHTALYMYREASGLSFESKGDRTMNLRYDAHATRWETALDTRVPAARFAHKTNRESGHVPSACPSHPQCAGTSRYTAATRRSSLSRRWPTAQFPSQRRPCRHRLAAEVLHHGALAGAESCGKVLCRWQTSAPARSRA